MSTRHIIIKNCNDCPNWDHSGAFTPGGAKPVCNNGEVCKSRGYSWHKRKIREDGKIPGWCPLKKVTGGD